MPLFQGWKYSGIELLYKKLEKTDSKTNYVIYKEGDSADSIYFILDGSVKIYDCQANS